MDLKKGEMICPQCHGEDLSKPTGKWTTTSICGHCKGEGKVDWIENVVGKKPYMITPGVHIREVDLSIRFPVLRTIDENPVSSMIINMDDILA